MLVAITKTLATLNKLTNKKLNQDKTETPTEVERVYRKFVQLVTLMGIEMTDRAMNMVDAYIRSNTKELYIELEPGASLNIPVQQQACLSSYIDERVYFGIRPDFVYLADDNEELNTIDGQLIDYKKTNNSFENFIKDWSKRNTVQN